jgi:hypothetical protein
MNIIKSNSTLIGFDKNNSNNFKFLSLIQTMALSINKNNLSSKFIGSNLSRKNQFNNPDVVLDISYFQKIDMYNESIFNLQLNSECFLKNIINNFYTRSAFIIIGDLPYLNINEYILKNNYSTNMITIALGNIYLDKYSISYSLFNPGLVNCSFVADSLTISNPIDQYKFLDAFGSENDLPVLAPYILNEHSKNIKDQLFLTLKNFNLTSSITGNNILGINLYSLLTASIDKFDFSINFNRSKYYFFESESKSSVSNRNIILPLKYSLSISGTSTSFSLGTLDNLKLSNNFVVSCVIFEQKDFIQFSI